VSYEKRRGERDTLAYSLTASGWRGVPGWPIFTSRRRAPSWQARYTSSWWVASHASVGLPHGNEVPHISAHEPRCAPAQVRSCRTGLVGARPPPSDFRERSAL